MQTVQSSVLVLYTSLLTASTTNQYGTANVNFTDVTFTNINIRQILGDNYDKYYKFNLVLNSIVVPINTGTAVGTGTNSAVQFFMSGLPFDTCSTYSTITGTISNSTLFGAMRLQLRGDTLLNSDVATFPPQFFNTFLRPTDNIVNINITIRNVVGSVLPAATIYPRFAYSFSIVPVLDTALLPFPSQTEQSLINKQRLFK